MHEICEQKYFLPAGDLVLPLSLFIQGTIIRARNFWLWITPLFRGKLVYLKFATGCEFKLFYF